MEWCNLLLARILPFDLICTCTNKHTMHPEAFTRAIVIHQKSETVSTAQELKTEDLLQKDKSQKATDFESSQCELLANLVCYDLFHVASLREEADPKVLLCFKMPWYPQLWTPGSSDKAGHPQWQIAELHENIAKLSATQDPMLQSSQRSLSSKQPTLNHWTPSRSCRCHRNHHPHLL